MNNKLNNLDDKDKKITLKDFLIKEHHLINSLGIFSALTLFVKHFSEGTLGLLLSLLFLLLTILIFFELWEQFPKERGSLKLDLFESYLSVGSFLIFIFWLSCLKNIDPDLPIFVISLIIYGPIMAFIHNQFFEKLNLFNRIFQSQNGDKKSLRYIFGYSIMFIIFFGIYFLLSLVKSHVNSLLSIFSL